MQDQCTCEDLRVDAVMTVSVDDNGMPIYDVPVADPVEEQPYWCVNCDRTFQWWDEAVEHLTVKSENEIETLLSQDYRV